MNVQTDVRTDGQRDILVKEDSYLEISLEALASQKPMLWDMKKLY